MLKIGITGGIGSGKTTVCRIFELLGIPIFYADAQAKLVMHTDEKLRVGIIQAFGFRSYLPDGSLDRKHIADIVFKDQRELSALNALVHPAVFRAFDLWALGQTAPYVVKEAALLFESGSDKMCDYAILIKTPDRIKIARVIERDHITEADIRLRMARQWSDKEKEKLADYIILNNEKLLLIPQVLALHERFVSLNPILA